jgi:hypothetical protein
MTKKKAKSKEKEMARVNPELKGLDISINQFGELVSNVSLDKLNNFLDRNVTDKKLEEKYAKEKAAKEKLLKDKEKSKKKKKTGK